MGTIIEFPKQRIVRTKAMIAEREDFQRDLEAKAVLPEDWDAAMKRIAKGGHLFDRERIMKRLEQALIERGRP